MSKTRPAGFTLVELLIVIALLGILAALSVGGLTLAQRQGRDAKRKSDLNAIAQAVEQSFEDLHYYPASSPDHFAFSCSTIFIPPSSWSPSYVAIASTSYSDEQNRQMACENLNTASNITYMKQTPFDPADDDPVCPVGCTSDFKYRYYSYNKSGTLCSLGGPSCPLVAVMGAEKWVAFNFKLVAIMDNKANATNAPGDQDPAICPSAKAGYCYVISSRN